jgi:hypothetical protein
MSSPIRICGVVEGHGRFSPFFEQRSTSSLGSIGVLAVAHREA